MPRFLSVLILAVTLSALGQDAAPYLVRDLPGLTVHDSMKYGDTDFWANTGNITWFTAMTASGGREIFKTDGTSAGTVQVTHGVGVPESQYNGPFLGVVNGKLIYGGVDGDGHGLFALDTNGGDPVLLGRFQIAYLTNGIVRGETLYFSGRTDTSTEHELWSTGGTSGTTVRNKLLPGELGAFNGSPDTRLYSAGAWMYFSGTTPQGTGLHRTDGTVENTLLLFPFPKTFIPSWTIITPVGDRLLFSFATTPTDFRLRATDGTPAGTLQIAAPLSSYLPLGVVGGKLFFDNAGIWTTDGTPAGTHPSDIVKNFAALSSYPIAVSGHVVGDRLFFIRGGWVYVTDGTAAGTHSNFFVTQDYHAPDRGFGVGNFYYFQHDDGVHGRELWRTDGTTAELVADINLGARNGIDDGTGFERPDGKALFAATNYNSGREPWVTDGTAAGTHILQNIAAEDPFNGSSPSQLRASGPEIFFQAHLTSGPAIGMSDGTSAGTTATGLDYGSSMTGAAAANGHYFFYLADGFYASDGTSAGTAKLFNLDASASAPLPVSNGVVFITRRNQDLWFSDGTVSGTRKVRSFDPSAFTYVSQGSGVVWIANGTQLWRTDGTEEGTVPLPLSTVPISPIFRGVIESGSRVYYVEQSSSTHGERLWRAERDGSNATMVRDFGNYGVDFVGATPHMVYFSADGSGKVYRSDGTDSGTFALPADLPAGLIRQCSGISAALGDTLLFISSTSSYYFPAVTLWRSDGTVGGTTALQVMVPPQTYDDDVCRALVARGNNVYYSGWDADHGWELWQSDGTLSGTRLSADIFPGPQSSFPRELTLAGSRLFFSADSPNIGRELWALPPQTIRHRAVRP